MQKYKLDLELPQTVKPVDVYYTFKIGERKSKDKNEKEKYIDINIRKVVDKDRRYHCGTGIQNDLKKEIVERLLKRKAIKKLLK